MTHNLIRHIWLFFGSLLVCYVLSYAVLSLCGQYQPSSVGLGRVISYDWAPLGFYDSTGPWPGSLAATLAGTNNACGGWNRSLERVFYPLCLLDRRYVHKPR